MEDASLLQLLGAFGFGVILGWHVYYINRYRRGEVQLTDLVALVGVLGGGAVLALFPPKSDLFGAYGLGLFVGFFGYLATLVVLVARSSNFDADWFLDGRRKEPQPPYGIPQGSRSTAAALEARDQPDLH